MSKFLKFIVNLIVICVVLVAGMLIVKQVCIYQKEKRIAENALRLEES